MDNQDSPSSLPKVSYDVIESGAWDELPHTKRQLPAVYEYAKALQELAEGRLVRMTFQSTRDAKRVTMSLIRRSASHKPPFHLEYTDVGRLPLTRIFRRKPDTHSRQEGGAS